MENAFSSFPTNPGGIHFHKVISLHEQPEIKWDQISKEVPLLPKGWYELSHLSISDRIEFTREYWLTKIPFENTNREKIEPRIVSFFDQVEDIGIFAVQMTLHDPFTLHMVYSLKGARGHFQGGPGASKDNIANLEKQFGHVRFPHDYLSFLEIHDGFNKYTDTGLISTKDMAKTYLKFQELLANESINVKGVASVNPMNIIPFYESYELHSYQCFNAEWYPQDEMGNQFFTQKDTSPPHSYGDARPYFTFIDWLLAYLEDV